MQLTLLTGDQSAAQQEAAIQAGAASGGVTITLADGSPLVAVVNAVKGVFLWLQFQVFQTLKVARLTTSTGTDIDSFCDDDFQCPRLPGSPSSGPATLSRYSTTSSAILPVGTIVKTTDGTQSFAVLADSTNAAWQAPNTTYPNGYFLAPAGTASLTVAVANVIVGAAGNILANAIGLIASVVPFDTVTNAAAFTNGINAESDAAYQARFGLFLPALARATPIALESATVAVAQNITCAILNCVQAVGGAFAPGYGVIAVDDGSGATPSATLNAVAAAAAGDSIVALGSVVSVVQAPVVAASVVLTITCATAALKALTQPIVQGAIAAYIGALPVSTADTPAPLPYNILAKLAFDASSNVTNVTAITLNGSNADIGGSAGTVVRSSGVTVN